MKLFLFLILTITFYCDIVSQTDSCKHSGLYVDGYKIDKLECCKFEKLQIVMPYMNEMDKYSFFTVWVKYSDSDKPSKVDSGVCFLPRPILKETVKNGCFIFTVFNEDEMNAHLTSKVILLNDKLERSSINKLMFCESLREKKIKKLNFWLEGLEIVEKSKEKTRYSLDQKNGIKVNAISKIYTYKCFYNQDCNNSIEGFQLDDL